MMYELNVSPLGEIYEAIPTTTTTMTTRSNNDRVLVKGEEDRALKRSKKNKKKKEPTMYCEATMTVTTEAACCGRVRRLATGNTINDDVDVEPWMAPNHNQAEQIAKNPGIWKIPDFLDQSLVQRMLETFTNDADKRFARCHGESHNHLKCKQCFRLSPSSNSSVDFEESKLVQELLENIQYLWPSEARQRDYLYVQRTEPDCDATLVHRDVTEHDFSKSATATIVLYLSDGGAGVFFPESDMVVPPEAGMALTWLNVHEDGSHNPAAWHGVQATPRDASIRYSLTYWITLSDEEMMVAAARKK
jgi:hypothetical protein